MYIFNEKMMEQKKNSYSMGIIIIGILFFIFGFVTWLNATLIPYLKIACELQHEWQGYLVTFAFYIAYFVMALTQNRLQERNDARSARDGDRSVTVHPGGYDPHLRIIPPRPVHHGYGIIRVTNSLQPLRD